MIKICLNGKYLEKVREFDNLGLNVTRTEASKEDNIKRIEKARSNFNMLNMIWKTKVMRLRPKLGYTLG